MTYCLSGRFWNQFGAVDHNFAMEDLVHHGDFPVMLERGALKPVNHFLHTQGAVVPVGDKLSRSSLDSLYPLNVLLGVRIPHCTGIL